MEPIKEFLYSLQKHFERNGFLTKDAFIDDDRASKRRRLAPDFWLEIGSNRSEFYFNMCHVCIQHNNAKQDFGKLRVYYIFHFDRQELKLQKYQNVIGRIRTRKPELVRRLQELTALRDYYSNNWDAQYLHLFCKKEYTYDEILENESLYRDEFVNVVKQMIEDVEPILRELFFKDVC